MNILQGEDQADQLIRQIDIWEKKCDNDLEYNYWISLFVIKKKKNARTN